MNETRPNGTDLSALQALGIVWDVLMAIAIPTTAFALGGRWLDRQFGYAPLFTVIGLALAVVTAGVIVSLKADSLRKRLYPE